MMRAGYNERPFRQQLARVTEKAADEELTPSEAYISLREAMAEDALHTDTYASSSVTSGGHARRRVHESGLTMSDVIRNNTDTALQVCDGLYESRQMDPARTIEAVALGYIPSWKQSDYMEFWLATMAGLPASGNGVAQAIETFQANFNRRRHEAIDDGRLDMDIYNSSSLSPEERAQHYFAHATLFADAALDGTSDVDPIRRLVGVVDPGTSLGAQTEKLFANRIDAQLFRVAIAATGLSPSQETAPHQLIVDNERIVKLGGVIFDMTRREMMVLVPQE